MDPEDDDLPLDQDGGGDPPEPDEDDLPLDGEDDELPLEEDDELDPPAEDPPAPQPTRGERRFQDLNTRLRAAEEAAAAARREAEDLRQRDRQDNFRRQEEERLANMSEGERIEYRVNQRLNAMQFQTWDTNDRVQFEGLAARNPAVAALKDDVEKMFRERIQANAPVDRATIAKFLIGERALNRAPRAKAAGKRAEQQGRERNQVRAPGGRGGDNAGNRGKGGKSEREARAERLRDVEI